MACVRCRPFWNAASERRNCSDQVAASPPTLGVLGKDEDPPIILIVLKATSRRKAYNLILSPVVNSVFQFKKSAHF